MNPLEISDILYTIAATQDPRNLILNRNLYKLLVDHPTVKFIRTHKKSDVPKCGPVVLLSNCRRFKSLEIACEYGNLPVVKHIIESDFADYPQAKTK